jgi:hypothetical protein
MPAFLRSGTDAFTDAFKWNNYFALSDPHAAKTWAITGLVALADNPEDPISSNAAYGYNLNTEAGGMPEGKPPKRPVSEIAAFFLRRNEEPKIMIDVSEVAISCCRYWRALVRVITSITLMLLLTCQIPMPAYASQLFPKTPESLLDYQPEKHIIDKAQRKILDAANWNDKESLDSIEDDNLENLVCTEVQGIRELACGSKTFRAIGERKTLLLDKGGDYSIALWLNTSAAIFSGALIVKEADDYSLYWFRRNMSLQDLDHDGSFAIVTSEALIYKAAEIFGQDRDPSIWWEDVFVFDKVLHKADQRYPAFYGRVLAGYKNAEDTIRQFDALKYASDNKGKFADPDGWEKWLIKSKGDYLEVLATAIKAVEVILKKK